MFISVRFGFWGCCCCYVENGDDNKEEEEGEEKYYTVISNNKNNIALAPITYNSNTLYHKVGAERKKYCVGNKCIEVLS